MGRNVFLGVSDAPTARGRAQALPILGGSRLSVHTPFDAELKLELTKSDAHDDCEVVCRWFGPRETKSHFKCLNLRLFIVQPRFISIRRMALPVYGTMWAWE